MLLELGGIEMYVTALAYGLFIGFMFFVIKNLLSK